MSFSPAVPRVPGRLTLLVVAVAILLAAGLLAALSPAQAASQGSAQASTAAARPAAARRTPGFQVASLNLEKGMSVREIRADFRNVVGHTNTSVIGFQERLFSRSLMRRALPKHWRLLMARKGPTGVDDNPIAFNMRKWKLKNSWVKKLSGHNWSRNSGRTAHDQFGMVGVLKHRKTGHVIRVISFHLPPGIHNRSTGGPNWSYDARVHATWDMAATVRAVKRRAPKGQQFIAACDCNVTHSKDTGDQLVKGKISGPLRLATNYSVGGYRPGWRIDYVMAERRSPFQLKGWRSFRDLNTDHPGIVGRFKHR